MGFFDNFKKDKGKKMPPPPIPKSAQLFKKSPEMPLPTPPVQQSVANASRSANLWPSPNTNKETKTKEIKQPLTKISPVENLPPPPVAQPFETREIKAVWPEKQAEQKIKTQETPSWITEKHDVENQEIPNELPELPIPNPVFLKEDLSRDLPEFPDTSPLDTEKILESFPLPEFVKKQKSLFIRTDDYKQILTNVDTIKSYVQESPNTIYMLKNLKRNADIEHKDYMTALEDIQRKLMYVENVLSQATRY